MKTVINFGKYKGLLLQDLLYHDIDYLIYIACNSYELRKEAQLIYENHLKSEASKEKKYTVISQCYDRDLNWEVVIKIDDEKYYLTFQDKVEFNFSVCLEYSRMIFKNIYEGSFNRKKWIKAILTNYKPILKII